MATHYKRKLEYVLCGVKPGYGNNGRMSWVPLKKAGMELSFNSRFEALKAINKRTIKFDGFNYSKKETLFIPLFWDGYSFYKYDGENFLIIGGVIR